MVPDLVAWEFSMPFHVPRCTAIFPTLPSYSNWAAFHSRLGVGPFRDRDFMASNQACRRSPFSVLRRYPLR